MTEKKAIVTSENHLPVDPERSELPIIFMGDRVIILRDKPAIDETPGEDGSMIQSSGKFEGSNLDKATNVESPYEKGAIKSVGEGFPDYPVPKQYKAGLRVAYYHQQSVPWDMDGVTYDMIRVSDIFALL